VVAALIGGVLGLLATALLFGVILPVAANVVYTMEDTVDRLED